MKPKHILYLKGQHCETTTTGTLLLQQGIQLSEPMLFGIGEGLGFIFWKMKGMDFPFIGGRCKTDVLTQNICKNLNLTLEAKETSSVTKAWLGVKELIDNGNVVGLKLDCYHLEYFSNAMHFAGHYAALYDFDDEHAYLVDTAQQGSLVKTSLKSLALSRSEKGAMSSRNLFYTIRGSANNYKLEHAIKQAIRNNARVFLHPPISNMAYKGILKTADGILNWFGQSKNIESDFYTMYVLMEMAGTGGALFRNLYRDFLKESAPILNSDLLHKAEELYSEIAREWVLVADLFKKTSETKEIRYLEQAADVLKKLSVQEYQAMLLLSGI